MKFFFVKNFLMTILIIGNNNIKDGSKIILRITAEDNETIKEYEINIKIKDISVANRVIPSVEKEIYLEKGGLKVGADLAMGGTLSYLEKTTLDGQTIDEVINQKNRISKDRKNHKIHKRKSK